MSSLKKQKTGKRIRHFRGLLGAYRASAWKRQAEDAINIDVASATSCLSSAMRILDDVFRNDGYIKSACRLARNIFNEIAYCLRRKEYIEIEDFTNESLSFIHRHLRNTMEYAKFSDSDDAIKLISELSSIKIKNNPFKGKNIKPQRVSSYKNGIDYK